MKSWLFTWNPRMWAWDDPVNGYKITRFLEGVRVCNTDSVPDLERCMEKEGCCIKNFPVWSIGNGE